MDLKHYGVCNLKYKDVCKAQCVKKVVENVITNFPAGKCLLKTDFRNVVQRPN